jgi:hypothetical protein
MAYSQLIQACHPGIKIVAVSYEELQVIQPDPELVKGGLSGSVIYQAQFHAAESFEEVDQRDVAVWLDATAGLVHAEEIAVPGCAPFGVADGQDDHLAGDAGHRSTLAILALSWQAARSGRSARARPEFRPSAPLQPRMMSE